MGAALKVEPIAAPMGAVVRGADFSRLSGAFLDEVRAALAQHLVLVFRGHEPPSDEHLFGFASALGEILVDADITPEFKRPGFPGISIMSNIVEDGRLLGSTGSGEIHWHTDYSFRARVSKILFLEGVEVPPQGGNTFFADMYAALETMAPELRARLDGLEIVHTLKYHDDLHGAYEESARHPAIVTNPATGRRALYLSPSFHPRVADVDAAEGEALIRRLTAWATQEQFVYSHAWQPGDLVMWDSIGTVHRRDAFAADSRRYMRKMSMLVARESDPWPELVEDELSASR